MTSWKWSFGCLGFFGLLEVFSGSCYLRRRLLGFSRSVKVFFAQKNILESHSLGVWRFLGVLLVSIGIFCPNSLLWKSFIRCLEVSWASPGLLWSFLPRKLLENHSLGVWRLLRLLLVFTVLFCPKSLLGSHLLCVWRLLGLLLVCTVLFCPKRLLVSHVLGDWGFLDSSWPVQVLFTQKVYLEAIFYVFGGFLGFY